MAAQTVLGSLEEISIPALNVTGVLAKVDTGAFSGALHCTGIVEGDGVLQFTPLGDHALTASTRDYELRRVRSATGHMVRRYTIPVEIEIKGKTYKTMVGLSDRTMMRREMLLGRRFLLEHNMLVDVSLTRDIDDEAEVFLEE